VPPALTASRWWIAPALFLVLWVAYVAPARPMWGADTFPNRYLPIAILRHGTLYLDRAPRQEGWEQWRRDVGGHAVSDYPVGTALLTLPIYVPLVLAGLDFDSPGMERIENLVGAALAALTAVVFYFVLLRRADPAVAVVLTLVAGLATSTMSVNAHGLWHHNGAQLAIAASLYCLVRGRVERAWLARAALPLAFAGLLARPQAAPLIAPLVVHTLLQRPGIARCALWAAPVVALAAWYNLAYFGALTRSQFPLDSGIFSTPLGEGLYGVLLSPWKGLLVYSPIFLLSVAGGLLAWRPGGDRLLRALGVGVALSIAAYAKWMFWNGGATAGPRILGDLFLPLTMLLLPVVPWVRASWAARALAGALLGVSLISHALVATRSFAHRDMNEFNERLWLWRYHPIAAAIAPPVRPPAGAPEPFVAQLGRPGAAIPASRDGGTVRLSTGASRVRTGDRLAIGIAVETPRGAPVRDLYVGAWVPAFQTVAFFPGRRLLTTQMPLDRREWFRRLRAVPGGTSIDDGDLFAVTVFHHLARGTYWFFAALVEPGSVPWRVVAADAVPVVVE
jgi:hypothetical protein